jgi:hypothetical protein
MKLRSVLVPSRRFRTAAQSDLFAAFPHSFADKS